MIDFDDTMQGMLEAVEIERGNISIEQKEGMPAPTYVQSRYEESLARMPQPILHSQLPKVKMDLAGLSRYAKNQGKSVFDLTEEEKAMFIPLQMDFGLKKTV